MVPVEELKLEAGPKEPSPPNAINNITATGIRVHSVLHTGGPG